MAAQLIVFFLAASGIAVGIARPLAAGDSGTPDVVYRSLVLERTTGTPDTYNATFETCDPAASFRLVLDNGVDGGQRVASGSVALNGQAVVVERDFNQQVAQIVRSVTLQTSNALEVRLAGTPQGRARITVDGYPSCLRVRITAPAPHSVLTEPSVLVEGDVESRGTAAVRVRATLTLRGFPVDVVAPVAINGRRFTALVDLAPGPVGITVVATDDSGHTAEDSITMMFEPPYPQYTRPWRPDVSPTVGFAPLTVTFGSPGLAGPDVDLLDLDVDGDGIPDYHLSDFAGSPDGLGYTYVAEGLYVATMTMRDKTAGLTVAARVPINVIPRPDLVAIWNGLRAGLARGDLEAALRFVANEARDRYRRVFEDLRPDLAAVAADLRDVTPQLVEPEYATAGTTRVRNGEVEGFLIHFVRDADGVWRIASM